MTAGKITRGPWKVETAFGRIAVETAAADPTTLNRGCIVAECYGSDAEANVKAIAALPDLVKALRPFARHIGKSGEQVTLTIGKDTWTASLTTEDFERARDTLRKAGLL